MFVYMAQENLMQKLFPIWLTSGCNCRFMVNKQTMKTLYYAFATHICMEKYHYNIVE